MEYFEYGSAELDYLSTACSKMADAISRIGKINRKIDTNYFEAFVFNIISQLISTKAARTIYNRLLESAVMLTPEVILSKTDDEIKACGLSYRKVEYIKGLCAVIVSGELDLGKLIDLSDKDVIAELTKLKGIGVWSAEMFLIFSLQRPDVMSYGDLAIRKGIIKLHGLETISKKEFEGYRKLYSPYGSTASLYLWHLSAD